MKTTTLKISVALALAAIIGGCASPGGSIYVPAGGSSRQVEEAPEPPRSEPSAETTRTERKSEQPPEPEQDWERERQSASPSYQEAGDQLSPAAKSLIQQADRYLAEGNIPAAIAQLERAQRIAPRSAEVYFKLSEAYVASDQLRAAEQFTLKGLSLAGSDTRLQRSGWLLLADVRRERGNVAGANQAEERANAL
ncbi:tetratricopeptide repeat protein [Marinobacter lipolyticus]|uniref:tetratricopeptide repeat protein n=1 Tax=Marinobacter lipolyticus TaxID=209639 RepID=UPI001BCC489F|nr:tetratricopeptide repeat protein [Marinobacter lipolyticus]MBS8242217.1 tetratricopeptide repeat protein [Marinobacter lipolyticus]